MLGGLFETFAKFSASTNQISLFCPKSLQTSQALIGAVHTVGDSRRLAENVSDSASSADPEARELYIPFGHSRVEIHKKLFCSWQTVQSVWYLIRAGPLIGIATKNCPPPPGGKAACTQIITQIMLMFFNAAKFIGAATTNCVKGLNLASGCSLGSLNFISGLASSSSVISALADGACTDLQDKKRQATEQRINRKIREIKLIRSMALRRLLREKKLTGPAVAEATALIRRDAEPDPDNATVRARWHSLQHACRFNRNSR